MITTRSLLRDAVTAGWISPNLQRLEQPLVDPQQPARLLLLSLRWSDGRMS